ncbi:MAG: energy transducer TonB, partial [Bacteroidota bacterium]
SVPMVDGQMDGLHQYWSPQGELIIKGMETQGERTGVWEYYDEAGELSKSHDYETSIRPISEQKSDVFMRDGITYPSQTDNVIGQAVPVLDWPGINDFLLQYRSGAVEEPKPTNMKDVSMMIGYPMPARENGIQGNVVTRVLIGKDGIPIDNQFITNVSPHLSNAVEYYLMELRFTPAVYKEEAIPFWVNIPFNFKLLN